MDPGVPFPSVRCLKRHGYSHAETTFTQIPRWGFQFTALKRKQTEPQYLNEHIPINNSRHSRTTRYSNFNVLCPRYNRETEGGRTFLVTGTKIWNEIPLRIRMADSIRCFKHNMWTNIFSQQQFLSHFRV